jgi:hypothetical protein
MTLIDAAHVIALLYFASQPNETNIPRSIRPTESANGTRQDFLRVPGEDRDCPLSPKSDLVTSDILTDHSGSETNR